jgi:transposase InsO family protein
LARYGLSARSTGAAFVLSAATLRRWLADLRSGAEQLVRAREPLNKLPDLVRELSCFMKREWPRWGSRRIAGILARLGVRASRSSVQRMLRRPSPKPRAAALMPKHGSYPKPKAARDVYAVDFTRLGGLFRTVVIGCVIDLFSRKVLAVRICDREPSTAFACSLLADALRRCGKPKRVLTDKGVQFTSDRFEQTLRRRGIRHRFGAVGHPGLPTIDRFFRTLKDEFARGLFLYRSLASIEADLRRYALWHGAHRPHWGLRNRSPDEVFFGKPPRALRKTTAGTLDVQLLGGDRRLPLFRLRRSA